MPRRSKRIVADFPWPKSMRWGDRHILRWVRPLHGIVALLGEEIVPVEIDGISSGASTVGHRFHHPGPITIGGAADYAREAARLPCDRRPGRARTDCPRRRGELPPKAGLSLLAGRRTGGRKCRPDRMAGAAAGPVRRRIPRRAARGDRPHHAHQPEIFRLHERAKACSRRPSSASPMSRRRTAAQSIVEGNRRVLAARLADARFFWEQDLKVPLEEQARKLDGIVFHEKLGTVADKVERVAKLARWLVESGVDQGAMRTRPNARRGSQRPILSPAWSASSPSCRASLAAILPRRRANRRQSPMRSVTSMADPGETGVGGRRAR